MAFNIKNYEEKMTKTIASYDYNLQSIRAGQANAGVLNRVTFEYYGSPTPVNQMADIRMADARTLTITPYDASTLKAIEKAILMSDIGINPSNDGKMIRLVFPQVTEERRKEILDNTHVLCEKIAEKGLTLCANRTGFLPLNKNNIKNIDLNKQKFYNGHR